MSGYRRGIEIGTWCVVLMLLMTAPADAQRRGFGQEQPGSNGRKVRPGQPAPVPGAVSGAAAVEALGGELGTKVRAQGASVDAYAALLQSDQSIWITPDGQLMVVDGAEQGLAEPVDVAAVLTAPTAPTAPPPAPSGFTAIGIPIHHSRPGAQWTIYLDLDGEVVFSQAWRLSGRTVTGFTIDGDASTFTSDEQAVASRIWGRVAEDWAPFDVNVTTERPAVIGASVLWSIVGGRPSDLGFSNSTAGISLFSLGYVPLGAQTPTFTFSNMIGPTNHSDIGDVVSHEAGHMQGLLHDGTLNNEYYIGHGTGVTSWGPIMGSPFMRDVTQWSKGEYPFALNRDGSLSLPPQDDIAIIAGRFGLRVDDAGDTVATAQPLSLPEARVISTPTDVDVFALPSAIEARIEITPFRAGELTDGGNLDVAAEIVNASGVVVASSDDVDQTTATLVTALPPGRHYLRVRPSSNPANYSTYGSLGQYTVTATFKAGVQITGIQAPLPTADLNPGRTVPVKFSLSEAVAAARVQLWSSALAGDVLAETSCRAQTSGRHHCNLKLPSDLVSGATYWLVIQHQDVSGMWVTAAPASGVAAPNPLSFAAQVGVASALGSPTRPACNTLSCQ